METSSLPSLTRRAPLLPMPHQLWKDRCMCCVCTLFAPCEKSRGSTLGINTRPQVPKCARFGAVNQCYHSARVQYCNLARQGIVPVLLRLTSRHAINQSSSPSASGHPRQGSDICWLLNTTLPHAWRRRRSPVQVRPPVGNNGLPAVGRQHGH